MAELSADKKKVAFELVNRAIGKTSKFLANTRELLDTDAANLIEKATSFKISQLGTPVFDWVMIYSKDLNVQLNSGAYNKKAKEIQKNKYDNLLEKGTYLYDNYKREIERLKNIFRFKSPQDPNFFAVLLDNIEITIDRPRNIVQTTVIGLNDTVNEFIGNGNYNVTITGTLAGTSAYQTDTKRIAMMDALFGLPTPLTISSIYLNNQFDVTEITVLDYSFEQDVDYGNLTNFTITAISDSSIYDNIKETTI